MLLSTLVPSHAAEDVKAEVVSYAGTVEVIPGGMTVPTEIKPGIFLGKGSAIKTGPESYIELAFDHAKTKMVRVGEKSAAVITLTADFEIQLASGTVLVLLRGPELNKAFRVRTPSAICGTKEGGFRAKASEGFTDISVFEGKAYARGVKSDGFILDHEFWSEKGFERRVKMSEQPGDTVKMSGMDLDGMRKEFGLKNIDEKK